MALFTLPIELREQIYKLAFVSHSTPLRVVARPGNAYAATQPALSLVSRDLRAETLPVFYGYNTFSIMLLNERNAQIASSWLERNKQHVKWLRRIMLRGYCDFMEGVSGGPEVVIYQLPLRQPCTVEIAVQDRTREVNVTGRAVAHEVLHPETEDIKRLVQEAWMAGEGWTVERLTEVLYTFVKGLEFMQAWRSIPEEEEGEGLYLRADLGMEVTGSAMSGHIPLRTSRSEMQQREVRMLQATGLLEALGVLVG